MVSAFLVSITFASMFLFYHKSPVLPRFLLLNHAQSGHRPMRLWLLYAQSFHKPAILLWGQSLNFIFRPWPLKAALLQPFIQQQKPVPLPVQRLDPVLPPPAEQIQYSLERVQLELLLHDTGQSVYSPP